MKIISIIWDVLVIVCGLVAGVILLASAIQYAESFGYSYGSALVFAIVGLFLYLSGSRVFRRRFAEIMSYLQQKTKNVEV